MIAIGPMAAAAAATRRLNGKGWLQVGELGLALLLSASSGWSGRSGRRAPACARTPWSGQPRPVHADQQVRLQRRAAHRLVVLDPSRVAAQIVTGIGFLGAGLIFVRRDSVRGLTTAAAIWVTAAIGSAQAPGCRCWRSQPPASTSSSPWPSGRLPAAAPFRNRDLALPVRYPDGRGILRNVLREATARGFAIDDVATEALGYRRPPGPAGTLPEPRMVEVTLHVHGKNFINELAAALSEQQDVNAVLATDANTSGG